MNLSKAIARAVKQMKSNNAKIAAADVQTGISPQSVRVGKSANGKFDVWLSQDDAGNLSVEGIDWVALDIARDEALRKL